jgi:hypothetical protein
MSAAVLTPRVRILVLCEDVIENEMEEGVFTLVGVRQHLGDGVYPLRASLSLFLVLASPREGTYQGNVVIVRVQNDKSLRYAKFQVDFDEDHQVLPLHLDLGWCEFPEPGLYMVQVWFSPGLEHDVLKAELPFDLLDNEE